MSEHENGSLIFGIKKRIIFFFSLKVVRITVLYLLDKKKNIIKIKKFFQLVLK